MQTDIGFAQQKVDSLDPFSYVGPLLILRFTIFVRILGSQQGFSIDLEEMKPTIIHQFSDENMAGNDAIDLRLRCLNQHSMNR